MKNNTTVSAWARERNYLVSPVNGVLKYHRLGNQERNDTNVPYEQASLIVSDVSLMATEVLNIDSCAISDSMKIMLN